MYVDTIEAAYLAGRIRASRDLADKAKGCCARHAHEEIAGRYEGRLASLLRSSTAIPPVANDSAIQSLVIAS